MGALRRVEPPSRITGSAANRVLSGYGSGQSNRARGSAMAHWVLIPLPEEDLAGSLCWGLFSLCLVSCDHCCRDEQGEQDAVGERVHKPLRGYLWSSPDWKLVQGQP